MTVNPNMGFKKQIIGGNELTMDEYASYLNVLRIKPFLTANEASTLFDIGIGRVMSLMNEPDWDFTTTAGGKSRRKIHRESFERYLMTHNVPSDFDDDDDDDEEEV